MSVVVRARAVLAFLLPQHLIHKFKQHLRRRIVRQAEIFIEFVVVGFPCRKAFGGNTGILKHGLEPLRLRAHVGMIGDMKNEKGRMLLPFATCVTAE
jgi:hypothetical protein